MIGFLMGLLKNFMFVGFSVVEAFVFMLAFNHLLPLIDKFYVLPIAEIDYWMSLSLFLSIHFIGKFIKTLSPLSLTIKQVQENKK